jgi:hypothetical protein
MKRYPLFFVLLLASFGYLLSSFSSGRAQSLVPEFKMAIHFTDTFPDGSRSNFTPRVIGYDSRATDSLDTAFGEDEYPGGLGIDQDFFFVRPDTLVGGDPDAGLIDIMHKPALDSFKIDYKAVLSFSYFPGSLYWDPSQIPSIIKGIWIRPSWSDTPFVDMTKSRIFTVPTPSQQFLWGNNYIITIFYNMQPRFISPAAVGGSETTGAGLIWNAVVFPNPMPSTGALDVTLSQAASLSIVGYDVAGRELLRLTRTGRAGENILDLSQSLSNIHGAIMLHIDAGNGTRNETKNVMLVRE